MNIEWGRRWLYRRMAWKNDQHLWMDMHPRIAWALDQAYKRSWPFRDWLYCFVYSAQHHEKVKAIRDVYGDCGPDDHYNYDGTATDIYKEARQRGWTPQRGWTREKALHPFEPHLDAAYDNFCMHMEDRDREPCGWGREDHRQLT